MSAPSKAYAFQLVRVQSEERLTAALEPNFAPSLVTGCREAKGRGYWAITQVKGLSPEITSVSVADGVHLCGRQYSHSRYWRGYESPTGSETMARYQRESIGTRETQCIPVFKVCDDQPIDGEESQMVHWGSDQPIVVMKPRNGGGVKGLARKPLGRGHILRTQRRVKDINKTLPITYIGREVFLNSRMREICTSGSVRGLTVASERRWL